AEAEEVAQRRALQVSVDEQIIRPETVNERAPVFELECFPRKGKQRGNFIVAFIGRLPEIVGTPPGAEADKQPVIGIVAQADSRNSQKAVVELLDLEIIHGRIARELISCMPARQ